ncbi:MAG: hypothetical protein OEU36_16330, partial [Gammaproteobacteria bacterium]|nr:hypothetical protein [Gammaproteobacteria bacterium]
MTGLRNFVSSLLLGFGLSGCINSIYQPFVPDPNYVPVTAETEFSSQFDYDHAPVSSLERVDRDHSTTHYTMYNVTIPSIGINGQRENQLHAQYFQSILLGKKPLIIVLPIYGSHTYPSRKISDGLKNRSQGRANILRILADDFLFDWPAMTQAQFAEDFVEVLEHMVARVQSNVIDIRRYIDWAQNRPEVDPQHIGLIGFSMGAVIGGAIVAAEDRISVAALIMGGANPHEIFATCSGRIGNTRREIIDKFGWSKEEFRVKVENVFKPVNVALTRAKVPPQKIIIFDS